MSELAPRLSQDCERTVSEEVVAAVAARERIDPFEIDQPLYDTIDPEALDALFHSHPTQGHVKFTYYGYKVTVHSDGEISLQPVEE